LFNSIGVKLAKAASVPVVPLAMKTDIFENGAWIKDFGPFFRERTIHMRFGESMSVSGNGREEHHRIVEFIAQNLREWGGRIADPPNAEATSRIP
jgi:1-acyl-sn-glycerol-3-phosphate acyltransferase